MSEIREHGIELARKGEYQKALFYLNEALRKGDYIASNDVGVVLEKMGKYEQALDAYRLAADYYSMIAVYNIGNLYEQGMGVTVDYERAFVMYYRSMEMGYSFAYSKVAQCYFQGIGVKKNIKRGIKILFRGRRREDKQNPICTFYIGYDYECGIGFKRDCRAAMKYYKKAAKSGMEEALYNLALLYLYRDGVKHNIKKGIRLSKEASNKNYSDARKELFLLYYNGDLVKKDFETAKMYLFTAIDLLNVEALVYLAELYLNGDLEHDNPKEKAAEVIRMFLSNVNKNDQSSLNAYQRLKDNYPTSLDWELVESNQNDTNQQNKIAEA